MDHKVNASKQTTTTEREVSGHSRQDSFIPPVMPDPEAQKAKAMVLKKSGDARPNSANTMEPTAFEHAATEMLKLFDSCVDLFQHIHLGQKFADEFGDSLCKLAIRHVKFTRWGESMGLFSGSSDQVEKFNNTQWSPEKVGTAIRLLAKMQRAFETAKNDSLDFIDDQKIKGAEPKVFESLNEDIYLMDVERELLSALRKNASRGSRLTSSNPAADRILYRKEDFTNLTNKLDESISQLLELWPALDARQKLLCKADVDNINSAAFRRLLKINGENDKVLDEALKEKGIPAPAQGEFEGLDFGDVRMFEESKMQLGNKHINDTNARLQNVRAETVFGSGSSETQIGHIIEISEKVAMARYQQE